MTKTSTSRDKMMDILQNKYKISFIRTAEEFYGRPYTPHGRGIWLSAEYDETIQKMLAHNGWWAELYDADTIMLYPN